MFIYLFFHLMPVLRMSPFLVLFATVMVDHSSILEQMSMISKYRGSDCLENANGTLLLSTIKTIGRIETHLYY